jgi:hypothetical protein
VKLFNRSYLRLVGLGVFVFVIGLGIGGTQGQRETVLNSLSAVLLTLGALMVVVALILGVVRRTKRATV